MLLAGVVIVGVQVIPVSRLEGDHLFFVARECCVCVHGMDQLKLSQISVPRMTPKWADLILFQEGLQVVFSHERPDLIILHINSIVRIGRPNNNADSGQQLT